MSGEFQATAALTEAMWAPDPVLRFLGREKSLAAAEIRTPNYPARRLVAIQKAQLRP